MRTIPIPALPVAAIVCGYSSPHRERRCLTVLKAYIDDSATQGKILVLGGFIAPVASWEAFSNEWQERLDHAGWRVFKMNKVFGSRSADQLEHAKWHYYTIRKYVTGAICMIVPIPPLVEAIYTFGLYHTAAANSYTWAFKGLFSGLANYQQRWGINGPVDIIFDERSEENQVREGWQFYKETASNNVRHILGRKPIFEDDEKVLPLQAADLWAWWCRRTVIENGFRFHADRFPAPWGSVEDFPQMVLWWNPADLKAELRRVCSGLANASGGQPS